MIHGNKNYHRCPACACICQTSEYQRAVKMVKGDSLKIAIDSIRELEKELKKAKIHIKQLETGGRVSITTVK